MKLASWNVQGAQGTLSLQRWANILQLIHECGVSLAGIQEYRPGFPLPEAATTALQNDYKCYASPGKWPTCRLPCQEPHSATHPRGNILPTRTGGGIAVPTAPRPQANSALCVLKVHGKRQN